MTRTITKLLTITLLALLCFQSRAFPVFGKHSLRKTMIIPGHKMSTGVVELKKDSDPFSGFYAEAQVSSSPSSSSSLASSSRELEETVKMMISISNSKSMVATKCFSFTPYDCEKYTCNQDKKSYDLNNPAFVAQAGTAGGEISLDDQYWALRSPSNLFVATSCQTADSAADFGIGTGKSGVLGLGTGDGGASNFKSTKKFSVFIKPDLSEGKLIFNSDTSFAGSSKPDATLLANSNWQTKVIAGQWEVNGLSFIIDEHEFLMFDINSEAIGLPYLDFVMLLNNFVLFLGIECTSDNYRPLCHFANPDRRVDGLPDITLSVNGNKIRIPWQIYATPVELSSFYFNFRGHDPHYSGPTYINPAFQDAIILDAHFMSYYHTVFDAATVPGTNVISLSQIGRK